MREIRNYNHQEFIKFVQDELADIKDMQLLIIKGHIMVEFALNCYLESISKKSDADFFSGFTFARKVEILEHFGKLSINLHEELDLLNKVRNSIAHTLRYNHSLLKLFLSKTTKIDSLVNSLPTDLDKMFASLALLLGTLFASYKEPNLQ